MRRLYLMTIRGLLPVLVGATAFFVLILQLVDLFPNLWRFIANDVELSQIGQIAYHYLPTCIVFAVPVGLLFAIAYTLGQMQQRNELIAVLASGISLVRFVVPFLLVGALLSVFLFRFEDQIAIPSLQAKNVLFRDAVNMRQSLSNANVTVLSADSRSVIQVDYYNHARGNITGVLVVVRPDAGRITRIDAEWGEWQDGAWVLHGANIYEFSPDGGPMSLRRENTFSAAYLQEPPAAFQKTTRNVAEMEFSEATAWVQTLRDAGLPFREAQTELYNKVTFAGSPLIVALLASAVGGLLRKNVLLLSLLFALGLSVAYFVIQMLGGILAKSGVVSPIVGASAATVIFALLGAELFRRARS